MSMTITSSVTVSNETYESLKKICAEEGCEMRDLVWEGLVLRNMLSSKSKSKRVVRRLAANRYLRNKYFN